MSPPLDPEEPKPWSISIRDLVLIIVAVLTIANTIALGQDDNRMKKLVREAVVGALVDRVASRGE